MLVNLKVVNFFWNPCLGANYLKRKLKKFYKIALLAQFSYFMVVQIQFYSRRCILQYLQIQQTDLKNNQCYRTSKGL